MVRYVTTFPRENELRKAQLRLTRLRLPYEILPAPAAYARVGTGCVVVDSETRAALARSGVEEFLCSGWVEYRPSRVAVPSGPAASFKEDVFGEAAIIVLAPCVADSTKIRIIAHISGDLGEVFPYLNAEMREACYNENGPTFTFMHGYRMISVYPRRIAVAKADEIIDAWAVLEMIRRRANEVWARRGQITPSYEMREKPPALEIFKRLPRTNCTACGELTCLAFAVKLWQGQAALDQCRPVFEGEYGQLRDALVEICAGLGLTDSTSAIKHA